MKGRWRRKCLCTLAWALAAGRRAQIFELHPTLVLQGTVPSDFYGPTLRQTNAH
jgi:hypothetical protein